MTKKDFNRESIRWLALEGAAIVVSILLAFSIQAWWEVRQDRNEVRDLLVAIETDFAVGQEFIDYYRVYTQAQIAAAENVLKASANDSASDEVVVRGLADLIWFTDIEVMPLGSIESLLNSGNFGELESSELRSLISEWPALVEYSQFNLKQHYDFLQKHFVPYVKRRQLPDESHHSWLT